MMKRVFLIAVLACMAMGAAYAQVNEDERTAYNRAIETGTVEAWQSFLADYPSGHYVEQARKLQLSVSAEGIESMEQLAMLRKCGCTEGQGFCLSKPISVQDFESVINGEAGK